MISAFAYLLLAWLINLINTTYLNKGTLLIPPSPIYVLEEIKYLRILFVLSPNLPYHKMLEESK